MLLQKKYSEEKERLMKQLEAIDTCALTTDFWSSADTHSYYITVTCHFTDALWELHSCVLVTYWVSVGYTAENIAAELKEIACDWKIEEKISCIVSDSAANMVTAAGSCIVTDSAANMVAAAGSCIVTDSAANMVAAAGLTGRRHLPCFAHTFKPYSSGINRTRSSPLWALTERYKYCKIL